MLSTGTAQTRFPAEPGQGLEPWAKHRGPEFQAGHQTESCHGTSALAPVASAGQPGFIARRVFGPRAEIQERSGYGQFRESAEPFRAIRV